MYLLPFRDVVQKLWVKRFNTRIDFIDDKSEHKTCFYINSWTAHGQVRFDKTIIERVKKFTKSVERMKKYYKRHNMDVDLCNIMIHITIKTEADE